MNDNDSIEALVARCRTLEQVIALLTEHVSPRSAAPPALSVRVLSALEDEAVRRGFPASTLATLRRAAAVLNGDRRAAGQEGGPRPSR
ncbi:hypothetical protein U8607_18490 [Methylobacterium durans]|uniref:hypothetical protein n=1 Tax=Methylobacterium durans TaxID=2202825 RepID=UPI002AFF8171|nr:hypothetical protein [Methylobacterium durans]MEA1834082.1 hypothetical protein [Methylobacterium durans]